MKTRKTPALNHSISRPVTGLLTALVALSATANALAGGLEKRTHVIKVNAGNAEVVEADVTDLALGESLNFVTDSGRVVDILRGPEGIEIYLDGELLDPHAAHGDEEMRHKRIAIRTEEIEIHCDEADEQACLDAIDIDVDALVDAEVMEDARFIVIETDEDIELY
ncbi:MAG: hypothetical protein V2I57_10045 [Xanthomonadales bacterium]|jgi:hypothetical protein|nr:hypothetical protein [Xanthomonadales bacterium]